MVKQLKSAKELRQETDGMMSTNTGPEMGQVSYGGLQPKDQMMTSMQGVTPKGGLYPSKGLPQKQSGVGLQIGGTIGAGLPSQEQIQEATPFVQEQQTQQQTQQTQQTPKTQTDYTLSKIDIIEKAKREHPRLQEGLDKGAITEEDIFSKVLVEHPKIKALYDQGEIDMSQEQGFEGDTQSIFQSMPGQTLPYADPISPYRGDENVGEFAGGMATNLPTSAWNIISGLGNMVLSPIQTIKSIGQAISGAGAKTGIGILSKVTGKDAQEIRDIVFSPNNPAYNIIKDLGLDLQENDEVAGAMAGFFKERYGGKEELKKTIKEDPLGIVGDVVSVLQGGTIIASRVGLINNAQKTATLSRLASVDPYIQVPAQTAKVGGKILGATGRGFSAFTEAFMNKVTAIDADDRAFARRNPELVNAFVDGSKTVDDVATQIQSKFDELSDTRRVLGSEYEDIRKSGATADATKIIDSLSETLKNKGINIGSNNELTFNRLSKFNENQQKAIQKARSIVQDVQGQGNIGVDDVLNLRQKLDDLINWEGKPLKSSAVDREAESIIRGFRGAIDDTAKTIPGLSELDTKFSPLLDDINKMRRDWFNPDGTLKDNALSKIKNLSNDANRSRLERLETIMPGITDEIKGLKVGLAVDMAMKARVGQYIQQMLLGGGIVSAFTNPALFLPLIGTGILFTPKNIIKVLQTIGRGQNRVEGVTNKIRKGLNLSSGEETKLQQLIQSSEPQLQKVVDDLQLTKQDVPANLIDNNMPGNNTTKAIDPIPSPRSTPVDDLPMSRAGNTIQDINIDNKFLKSQNPVPDSMYDELGFLKDAGRMKVSKIEMDNILDGLKKQANDVDEFIDLLQPGGPLREDVRLGIIDTLGKEQGGWFAGARKIREQANK